MGKKGKKFLGAIKKFFSPQSKEKKRELQITAPVLASGPPQPVYSLTRSEEIKLTEAERERSKHAYCVAVASAAAAEAAVAVAQAAAEVVRLSTSARFAGNSREVAAIKIQTAFRGHLARRALRALKGLVRLKSLVQGNAVKRQATTTLRCMQTLARIQSQIRSRRIRMLKDNQTLLRQHLLKRERELESLRMSEEWDDSTQSKEQIEASLLSKQEAIMRRERALAYAFSHQGKIPSRSANPTFMDANNPQWGWSWLERRTTPRPWKSRSPTADRDSMKSINGGEIDKSYASPRDRILERTRPHTPHQSTRPPSRLSPLTPPSKVLFGAGKIKSGSPRKGWHRSDDDTRSSMSLQSERRRHSLAGSSIRDDESLMSSVTLPSYMAPTESAKVKNRFHGSLGDVKMETTTATTGKDSANSVKKRLSFPLSPAAVRRHSAPTNAELLQLEKM